jgi:hypothetical protein
MFAKRQNQILLAKPNLLLERKSLNVKVLFIIILEAQWAEPVSLTFHSALRKLNTEPSIGVSHQVLVHLAKQLQRKRFFRNGPIRNKNGLWWPCLLTAGN